MRSAGHIWPAGQGLRDAGLDCTTYFVDGWVRDLQEWVKFGTLINIIIIIFNTICMVKHTHDDHIVSNTIHFDFTPEV